MFDSIMLSDASSGGIFTLSVECRFKMLFHRLQGIIKFMVGFFLVPFGGVRSNPIKGMPFSFMYTTQESKKCSKSKNWVNACYSKCMEEYVKMYKFGKSSQTKSTYFVVVQVVKKMKTIYVTKLIPCFFNICDPTFWTTDY
jgi:hypothetical protein